MQALLDTFVATGYRSGLLGCCQGYICRALLALHMLHLQREQVPFLPGCEVEVGRRSLGLWAHNGQGIASAASSGKQWQAASTEGRHGGKDCERRVPKIVGLTIDVPV
jgi:hypothetical protein